MKFKNNINGIILINKKKGLTSRDVVNKVEQLLNTKAGHTGTLDPLAEGVLVICLGKATKLTEILTSETKEYEAEVTLGFETDSLDTDGNIILKDNKKITKEEIENTLKDFIKTYNQEVPKYSAIKVAGKKLYEYARNNEEVVLPKKKVTIYDLNLISFDNNIFKFKAKVSKGTYIRSLIRDICHSLNTLGTMSALTRTSQGKFDISMTYTLEDVEKGNYEIIKIKDALDIKTIKVDKELETKIKNGCKLNLDYKEVLFTDKNGKELALYRKENNELKVWKML